MIRPLLAPVSACLLACAVLGCALPALAALPDDDDGGEDDPEPRAAARVRGEPRPRDKPGNGDGVYGRFDGDLTLTVGVGAELSDGARGALTGRALYYHSLGLVLGYADSFGAEAELSRVGSAAIEIRPLFLPRWALDRELGRPLLDLTLDSLALDVGVFVGERKRDGRTESGLELAAGFGIPLFARGRGLWLEGRGFLRPTLDDSALGVSIALAYYAPVVTPLVR